MPYKDTERRKNYLKLKYQNNKAKILSKAKEYYQIHKEEKKEKSAIYRKANPDKIKSYYKETREFQIRQVLNRRESRKAEYIKLKGGKCEICGFEYNGENAACFDFHHINPNTKEFGPADAIRLSRAKALLELEKCQLVCANCHRLIHYKSNI